MKPAAITDASPVAPPLGDDDVDVIIPAYNGALYIRDCLASVFSQTLQPRRVIVVDDGSTDNTVEVVRSIQESNPTLMLHRLGINSGVSAARNAGIGLSDAAFIAFIDADDIWLPNKLALQMQVLKAGQPKVGFVHSSYFLIDEAGNTLPHKWGSPPLLSGNAFSRLLREGNILSGSASSILIRRDVLDAAGVFDDQLYFGEDWDVWLRLAALSEVGHTPDAVVGIRMHQRSAQHRDVNRVDRFLQVMRVYSQWEDPIRKDSRFLKRLREDGFRAVLTNAGGPRDAASFYRTLKASPQALVRNLYASHWDFWSGLFVTAVQRVCRKLMHLVVGKTQRHLRDFGWIK